MFLRGWFPIEKGDDGRDQSCETKRGDNINWRTWSSMGVTDGATDVFFRQGGREETGRWREIGLSGWTQRVSRVCVSERSRSLPNRREGQIIKPELMWDFVSGQRRIETL